MAAGFGQGKKLRVCRFEVEFMVYKDRFRQETIIFAARFP
jgi:hypothetical protein